MNTDCYRSNYACSKFETKTESHVHSPSSSVSHQNIKMFVNSANHINIIVLFCTSKHA